MSRSLRAVVLDLDGVLVDSEPAHLLAWEVAAAEVGGRLPDDFGPATRGLRTTDTAQWLSDRLALPAGDLLRRRDRAKARLADRIRPFPEARAALDRLEDAGTPLAVGSSGARAHVTQCLRMLDLADVPAVCGEDVADGKPAPEVFLRCARLLDVDPAAVAVVEDAPNGVAAARAAGMTVVGVQRTPTPRLDADVVVDDLLAAADWLLARVDGTRVRHG